MKDRLNQALNEALGNNLLNDQQQKQVEDYLKNSQANQNSGDKEAQLQKHIDAYKSVLGVGTINPNVEQQLKIRVRALEKNPDAKAPGHPNQGVQANVADLRGGSDAGEPDRLASLKDGVQGDVNAQQKADFESRRKSGTEGGGNSGTIGPQTTGALSQVAAATNSGNQGVSGPGVDSMRSTGVGNPSSGASGAIGSPGTANR